VPGTGAAEGNAKLLRDHQKGAGPDSRAMHFARGPQVIARQQQQEKPAENAVQVGSACYHNEGRPTSGCIHKGDGCNQNKTFVCGGIEAGGEAKKTSVEKISMSPMGMA